MSSLWQCLPLSLLATLASQLLNWRHASTTSHTTSPLAWQKSMTTSSIADFIFACARGYNIDPSSLLKLADEIRTQEQSISVYTLPLFAPLRRKMAARPFLPFAMCNKNLALPNNILTSYGKIYRKAASLEVMPAQSIWAASRHTIKFCKLNIP